MIGGTPQFGVVLVYVLPLIIFAIVLYKIFKLAEDFIRSHSESIKEKLSDRDWMVTSLEFIPYAVAFYYIARYTMYIFSAQFLGTNTDELVVVPIRQSTFAMTDMLLMEGVPVTLSILIGTTILRVAYKYIGGGEE